MNTEHGSTKLVLGTVQFGLDYGVAGGRCIPEEEIHSILSLARNAGVDVLDTAPTYGNSEEVIGRYLNDEPGVFRIITKVPPLDKSRNPVALLQETFRCSLELLGVDSVYALLVHSTSDLFGDYGKQIFTTLQDIQSQGLAERIGISVYSPEEIESAMSRFPIQIVQAPVNVIDQRLLQDGMLKRLKAEGIEVHARSVFLQGLLLLPEDRVPPYFSPWSGLLKRYRTWCSDAGQTPVSACLQFVQEQPMIDKIIVGVDSFSQFRKLLEATHSVIALPDSGHLSSRDNDLINPSCWPH